MKQKTALDQGVLMLASDLKEATLFRQQAYFGGQWAVADDGADLEVFNPANGRLLATVPMLGTAEVIRAVDTAVSAWQEWREKTGHQRASHLRRWFELILRHADDLALILTAEQGKPLREARGEIIYAASFVEWFAEEAKRVSGECPTSPFADKRMLVMKQPVGVCAAITPWNFPAAMITRKVAPALAAGCPVIVKPSELTPLTALALARTAEMAELPPDVFQVVTGEPQTVGGVLTSHPEIRKFSFTGSTVVGRQLAEQCAPTVKRVSMELGGHAPFIIFEDADIEAAARGVIASKYRNNGQTCICANRLFVQDTIVDRFVDELIPLVKDLSVGCGWMDSVDLGPLINDAALAKVERHIEQAVGSGARTVLGGKRHALGGTFFEPTVLTDVTTEMLVAKEETFGPVCPVIRFSDEDQVVQWANDTPYGLAAYLFTRDVGRVWRVCEALEYGMIGVNTGIFVSEVMPFGGMKQSGIGREGSRLGIEEYLEVKTVCIGI